jgi:hypothetical protein
MIATTYEIEPWLRGDKVTAFYDNLLHPETSDKVTIDTWIRRVALNELDVRKTPAIPSKLYYTIADAYRLAASKIGVLPHQLQATNWLTVIQISLNHGLTANNYS